MQLIEALTLLAILIGPVAAVLITRWLDDRRDRQTRRMDVFRTLMRTRRTPATIEHVGALNLIEIEYSDAPDVLDAWKKLYTHFATHHARGPDESTSSKELTEQRRVDQTFYRRLGDERQRLLSKLLHAMATAQNFKIEQLEIFEGGYVPQGWEDEVTEQRLIRRFFVEMFMGRAALPVVDAGSHSSSPAAPNEPPHN